MNSRQPINMTYNQQTNQQFNDRRSLTTSRTKMIFNGPVHGYIERVTGSGPVVAYSQVTYVEHTLPNAEQTSFPATPQTRLPIESAWEDDEDIPDDSTPLISPSIPLPIDRNVLETEFRTMSPAMQKYVRHLLRQYEQSYIEAQKNGQACQDQR